MLLVKLKNILVQHAWILIVVQQNSNQKCESWKDGGIYQPLRPISSQVWFWSLFELSSKAVPEDLNMKCRSKLNHGCLHCAILKALYDCKVTRAHKARDIYNVYSKGDFWDLQNV